MENRLLVLLRDKGTDIHTDDTLTLFTDDRNREIMEKTSVNIMHSVYHDRAKDNRNTTGSGHRLYDGAATKLMALAIVKIGRHDNQRSFQLFKRFSPQMTTKKIAEPLAVEQSRFRDLQLGEFGELTTGKEFFNFVGRIAIGKQSTHQRTDTRTNDDIRLQTAFFQ